MALVGSIALHTREAQDFHGTESILVDRTLYLVWSEGPLSCDQHALLNSALF